MILRDDLNDLSLSVHTREKPYIEREQYCVDISHWLEDHPTTSHEFSIFGVRPGQSHSLW